MEFSPDGKLLLVANEAQNDIGVFDKTTGSHIRDIDLKPYGIRPRGVKVSPQGTGYAVTMEASGTLLTMDKNFNVLKSVATATKPYGLAFDRAGKRIFVSAAMARKLQVFSADSLELLQNLPFLKRHEALELRDKLFQHQLPTRSRWLATRLPGFAGGQPR